MFLLLSALYNFCTVFCSKLSATSTGGTETLEFSDLCCYFPRFTIDDRPGHQEFQEWRKRRFIKVGFIFNSACNIIIDSALHNHHGLVNWKLQWIGSRLRSTFDLCNPVFLLHCFIIQRQSLFLHVLIFPCFRTSVSWNRGPHCIGDRENWNFVSRPCPQFSFL